LKNFPFTIPSRALASDFDPVIRNAVGKFSLIVAIKLSHSSSGQICCNWILKHVTQLTVTTMLGNHSDNAERPLNKNFILNC
jgi:hypothetical protein